MAEKGIGMEKLGHLGMKFCETAQLGEINGKIGNLCTQFLLSVLLRKDIIRDTLLE